MIEGFASKVFRCPVEHEGPRICKIWLLPFKDAPNSAGLMGTFASSAAGSVAGNVIANTMFGASFGSAVHYVSSASLALQARLPDAATCAGFLRRAPS